MSVVRGKQTTIRFSGITLERLDNAAQRVGAGRNLVLETALTLGLDELDLMDDEDARELVLETVRERGGRWQKIST